MARRADVADMEEAIGWAAPVLYGTFFDLPLWQELVLGVIAGVIGLCPGTLAAIADLDDSLPYPWWLRVAVFLVGAAVTAALLLLFMLSPEMRWGGPCAPGC